MSSIDIFKIFDCTEGYYEEPTFRTLKENLYDYCMEFTFDLSEANLILTNDTFPSYVDGIEVPRIKVCPYEEYEGLGDNFFNQDMTTADKVIFTSQYLADQYFERYSNDLNHCVIPNVMDNKVFKIDKDIKKEKKFTVGAYAKNWSLAKNRLESILVLSEAFKDMNIILMGDVDSGLPSNIIPMGTVNDQKAITSMLNMCHAYVDLSYGQSSNGMRQAINCGLPVLYANNRSASEIVGAFGAPVIDDGGELDVIDIVNGMYVLVKNYNEITSAIAKEDFRLKFALHLDSYVDVFTYHIC